MHTKFNLFLGVAAFFLMGLQTASAQIFQTKTNIIQKYGSDYTAHTANDNTKYITYNDEIETEDRGTFTQTIAMYFVELDDKTEMCYMFKIFVPETEINTLKSYIRENLVQTDTAEWKDYDNKMLYQITTGAGLCVLTVVYNED